MESVCIRRSGTRFDDNDDDDDDDDDDIGLLDFDFASLSVYL
jgi:hypothetical protein